MKQGMVSPAHNPRKQRQEDPEFQASQGYDTTERERERERERKREREKILSESPGRIYQFLRFLKMY
jgi:hypothetical protein